MESDDWRAYMNYSDKNMHIREYKGILLSNALFVLVMIGWLHSFVSKNMSG